MKHTRYTYDYFYVAKLEKNDLKAKGFSTSRETGIQKRNNFSRSAGPQHGHIPRLGTSLEATQTNAERSKICIFIYLLATNRFASFERREKNDVPLEPCIPPCENGPSDCKMTLPPNPLAWLTFALVWPEWKVLRLGTPRGNAVRDAMLALPPGEIEVLAELEKQKDPNIYYSKNPNIFHILACQGNMDEFFSTHH